MTWQEKFIEEGANLEHDRWSRWMRYMISRMELRSDGTLQFNEDDFSRWAQQMITPYSELSEREKESDRKETRNYLPFIQKTREDAVREEKEVIIKKLAGARCYHDDSRGVLLSNPPQYECVACHKHWTVGSETPICEYIRKADITNLNQ